MQVDRNTIIGDILDHDAAVEPIFLAEGMACLGCPASRGETVEEACQIHGVDVDTLLGKLNSHFTRG